MTRKQILGLILIAVAVLAAIGGMQTLGARASSPAAEAAVRATVERDASLGAQPWIPCTNGQAAVLTAGTVLAQQRRISDLFAQTYAPTEPSHSALLSHLHDLVAGYGPGGAAVASGDRLCEPSGGIAQVQVVSFSSDGTTATISIHFHVWNETIGTHHGTPFHFRPENWATVTDQLVNVGGQWLITSRDAPVFDGGRSG